MKKILLFLTALMTMLVFTGCDQGAGDSKSLESDWSVKSTVDSWTGHSFTMDEENNNILTYEYTGLYPIDYSFCIFNTADKTGNNDYDAAGKQWKAPKGSAAITDGEIIFIYSEENNSMENAKFTATKSSYTVKVDITEPTAPIVSIIPGETGALALTFAIIADNLQIAGDLFGTKTGDTITALGWDGTAGVVNAGTKTVTFDNLVINSKAGRFGFPSLDDWVKFDANGDGTADAVASPGTEGASTVAMPLTVVKGDITLTDIPFSDSVYTAVVTIDETATTVAEKYSLVLTLETIGSTQWPTTFDPWSAVFLAGGITSWVEGSFEELTVADGKATYTFTATGTTSEFKVESQNDWDGSNLDAAGITSTGSEIELSTNGNIAFTSVVDTSYTITIDFTGTYVTTNVPNVTVVAN